MKLNYVLKFRIILWLILACFLVFFLWHGVVPSGKIIYYRNFDNDQDSYFIKKLTPEERVSQVENGAQKIIGDPAYFFLYTPRRFEKAKLIFKYRSDLPVIETGALMDKKSWNYNLYPVENKIIDNLTKNWDVIRDNDLVLLQRTASTSSAQARFNSVSQFLENPPDFEKIALYNFDLDNNFIIPGYATSSEKKILDYALRGGYQFYTYIKNASTSPSASEEFDFDFDFVFSDINKAKEADPINLNLYYKDDLIYSQSLDDDGIALDSGEIKADRTLDFYLTNLPEGAYKIELKASDDIITKEIKTKQSKIAFINKIWLHESAKENFSVFTDSDEVRAQTANPASLQKLIVGNKELDVNETYKQFSVLREGDNQEIKIEKSDIILAGNGVFSFTEEAMINPSFKKIDANFKIDGIDYILADYKSPKEQDGWKIAEVELNLDGAYREKGAYQIILSASGLSEKNYLELDSIKVELEGKGLWKKIIEKISNK